MAEAIIIFVGKQFGSLVWKELEQSVKPVASVSKGVKDLTRTLTTLQVLIRDAEVKQVTDPGVRAWLETLKDIAYDADDVVDEWCTRLQLSKLNPDAVGMIDSIIHNPETPDMIKNVFYYVFTPCYHYLPSCISCCVPDAFRHHHQIAHHIQDIKERLDGISRDNICKKLIKNSVQQILHRRPDTSSMVNVPDIFGRDGDKRSIVHWLQGESSQQRFRTSVPVLSIVGTGGFGKTTLAQLVYQQEKLKFELSIWVCVSQPFDRVKVAKEIIEQATRNEARNFVGWESLHQQLSDSVRGKRFLIVFDDVWSKTPDDWAPFELSLSGGAQGSKVIVTTRDMGVATMMDSAVHTLAGLSDQDCWLLFRNIAFGGRSEKVHEKFEDIGKQIAKKCKGIPLAVKTVAGVVRHKQTKIEWRNVLENDIWKIQQGEDGFLPSLLLSYDDLPLHLKQCVIYCAIFPKDEIIQKDALVKLWMAQGFLGLDGDKNLEMIGGEYFDDLAMRSLFQDFKKGDEGNIIQCKMHDLVHDFVQFLSKTECAILEMNNTVPSNAKLRYLNVGDEYLESPSCFDIKKLRTLLWRQEVKYLRKQEEPDTFRKLFCQLTCLRLLDLSFFDLKDLPDEVGRLLHLRYLKLSGEVLTKLPETMCDLYNLQTLELNNCPRLSKLPEGFGRLVNLRHLECKRAYQLKYFPQGFGKLKHLRTLPKFCVSNASGGCKLGELKDLNLIVGELDIYGLGQVESIDEVNKAELQKKENLVSLTLRFSYNRNTLLDGIFEGLQPPCNLEELSIIRYRGLAISPINMPNLNMPNLRKLHIQECPKLKVIPNYLLSPNLVKLKISDCPELTVGMEPYNLQSLESLRLDGDVGVFSRSLAPPLININTLQNLKFIWSRQSSLPEGLNHLTSLQKLEIHYCKLMDFDPEEELSSEHFPNLRKLEIDWSPLMSERCSRVNWSNLSHISNIRVDFKFIRSYFKSRLPTTDEAGNMALEFGPWLRAEPLNKTTQSTYQAKYVQKWSPGAKEQGQLSFSGTGKSPQQRQFNSNTAAGSSSQALQMVQTPEHHRGWTGKQQSTVAASNQALQALQSTEIATAGLNKQSIVEGTGNGSTIEKDAGNGLDTQKNVSDFPVQYIAMKAGDIILANPSLTERKLRKLPKDSEEQKIRAKRQLNFEGSSSSNGGNELLLLTTGEENSEDRSQKISKNSEIEEMGEDDLEGEFDSGIPLNDEDYGIDYGEEEGENDDMIPASEATPPRQE